MNGTGKIDRYAAYVPPVGIRMTKIVVDNKWECLFQTAIIPGSLARLTVKSNPVTETDLVQPGTVLPQTTEILTVDTCGNPIDGTGIILNASFVSFDENGVANLTFSPQSQIQVRDTGVAVLVPFPKTDFAKETIVFGTDYVETIPRSSTSRRSSAPAARRRSFRLFH